jgi:hypothetical protein
VSIAPRHHHRVFGHTQIGLPQPHSMPFGQAIEPSDGRVQQLGTLPWSSVSVRAALRTPDASAQEF